MLAFSGCAQRRLLWRPPRLPVCVCVPPRAGVRPDSTSWRPFTRGPLLRPSLQIRPYPRHSAQGANVTVGTQSSLEQTWVWALAGKSWEEEGTLALLLATGGELGRGAWSQAPSG